MTAYESPEERRQRAGIIEVPLPGKSAKKLNGGSHNGAERRHGNGATRGQIEGVDFRPEIEVSQSRAGPVGTVAGRACTGLCVGFSLHDE